MRTDTAATIHRLQYSPPTFWADTIDIGFDLDPQTTRIAARTVLRRNTEVQSRELVLFGEDLTLVALRMNGRTLGKRDYRLSGGNLIIDNAP
jgi:aminopeptidase N